MTRVIHEDQMIAVPEWVVDLASFRRWGRHDDFPEKANLSFLRDEVWLDLSREQLYTHNQVKAEICAVLGTSVKAERWAHFFSWGAYLSNVETGFSHKPDGTFVSFEAMRDGRLRVVETEDELEGSPDMVLDVVSRSSIERDNEVLREAYFRAGVREYWLVDARKPPLKFDILRPGKSGFVACPKRAGWTRSDVFAASFRLTQQTGEDGYPAFTLDANARP
jgi:Uma2 family endonuclease